MILGLLYFFSLLLSKGKSRLRQLANVNFSRSTLVFHLKKLEHSGFFCMLYFFPFTKSPQSRAFVFLFVCFLMCSVFYTAFWSKLVMFDHIWAVLYSRHIGKCCKSDSASLSFFLQSSSASTV